MTKDIIYIDVEDDITAVVGKIKDSKKQIIALVPPNRVGILQSTVNMRLLQRTAKQDKKHLVLISNNDSLKALASVAKIPVAKTLQSKPELIVAPVLKIDNEIIDGSKISVEELDASAKSKQPDESIDAIVDSVAKKVEKESSKSDSKEVTKSVHIPDFSVFRKKMAIFFVLFSAILSFLVWAIWFAPAAKIIITAKTTTVNINKNIELLLDGKQTSLPDSVKAVRKQEKQDFVVSFKATGKKKIGDKATGIMRVTGTAVSSKPTPIPAGTAFSAGDYTFVSLETVTLKGASIGLNGIIYDSTTVKVQATHIGEEYNLSSRDYISDAKNIKAFGDEMSGGSSREVDVVTEEDIEKAKSKLQEQKTDDLRQKIISSFSGSNVLIEQTYEEKRQDPVSSVKVDEEAKEEVKLTSSVVASMIAVDKGDLNKYIEKNIQAEIATKKSQKVYKDGIEEAKFTNFRKSDNKMLVNLSVNSVIGPTVNNDVVKEQSQGKTFGEVQRNLEAIEGVDTVDIQFSPFWVRNVPSDLKRITIEFKISDL